MTLALLSTAFFESDLLVPALWVTLAAVVLVAGNVYFQLVVRVSEPLPCKTTATATAPLPINSMDLTLLPCIRKRRSIFPKQYLHNPPPLDPSIVSSLLEAAKWAPYHGRCYGNAHPARFVVLGKQSMVEMQELTLAYYDKHWNKSGSSFCDRDAYEKWRSVTQEEITGRWGPVSYMIAIVMQRQSGPKRLPEWEEAAAVAAAVQNMHLQSTKFPHLACYWSSWHDQARDSQCMKEFLQMGAQDKCLGFFIVAQIKKESYFRKDRRVRDDSVLSVEWRP